MGRDDVETSSFEFRSTFFLQTTSLTSRMNPTTSTLPFPFDMDQLSTLPTAPYLPTPTLAGLYHVHHGAATVVPPPPPSSLFPPCPRCSLDFHPNIVLQAGFFCPHRHSIAFPYAIDESLLSSRSSRSPSSSTFDDQQQLVLPKLRDFH